MDGTLIQAWAPQKSFRRKDGSDDGDGSNFHGEKRSNQTYRSTTDADARLCQPTLPNLLLIASVRLSVCTVCGEVNLGKLFYSPSIYMAEVQFTLLSGQTDSARLWVTAR